MSHRFLTSSSHGGLSSSSGSATSDVIQQKDDSGDRHQTRQNQSDQNLSLTTTPHRV